jgi:hypothetical protein
LSSIVNTELLKADEEENDEKEGEEVLRAASAKITGIWDVTLCSYAHGYQHCEKTCYLHL